MKCPWFRAVREPATLYILVLQVAFGNGGLPGWVGQSGPMVGEEQKTELSTSIVRLSLFSGSLLTELKAGKLASLCNFVKPESGHHLELVFCQFKLM